MIRRNSSTKTSEQTYTLQLPQLPFCNIPKVVTVIRVPLCCEKNGATSSWTCLYEIMSSNWNFAHVFMLCTNHFGGSTKSLRYHNSQSCRIK